jgi:hypothetical protein
MINNSAALLQERRSTRLYVCSGKLILAAMFFWRVGIDGRSYAAAPTDVSKVVTPSAPKETRGSSAHEPAPLYLFRHEHLLGRCVAEQSKY